MKCLTQCLTLVLGAMCAHPLAAQFEVIKTTAATNGGSQETQRVSIVALIASPRQYNRVRVYVTGYLDLSYESDAVYLHEEDFRYGMTKNAIRLTLRKEQEGQFKVFSRKYVIIEGTFAADDSPSGMFSGHMVNVNRMQELQTEEEFRRRPRPSAPTPQH
jgi:glyoxylate utilization-related uncharacterized protein